ncbi:DNA mismatch repair endonuclease MutL [Paenibacillus daejeonensis]|uniref:DNA mismatch repair endonuclease MutL n=1 Tax=Paenibacillus daejeonensis TaxID=135193 RepID=UPI0003680404|nr:DNA mismatch repair endonuclease MutL [Paenibacillus daejeonensis]
MGKIQVMGEQLANQIAAGEVVERPSSVVKELVENAVDAGSTQIDVTIEEGGLQLIRITDNGSGIEEDDMETAFQRHATSKLLTGKDLFRIASLGFRGEALPSIAAVARVECISSTETNGLGRRYVIEGGKQQVSEPYNCEQGTDMVIRDLFYNTPARLKYMKSVQTELGHISDYVYRLSLAHPGIAFTLKHNGNTLLRTLGNGDRLQVIAAVYGRSLAKAMLPVQGDHPDYIMSGYISRPEQTRANRGGLTMVVNGRYIRSFILNQAIQQAYHTLLPINRFPVAVLEIGMHPTLVDVNVHPSKMEVRFSKEPELREFVQKAVRGALAGEAHIPGPSSASGARGKPLYTQGVMSFHREAAATDQQAPPVPQPSSEGSRSIQMPERQQAYIPRQAAERLYRPGNQGGGASVARERWEIPVQENPKADGNRNEQYQIPVSQPDAAPLPEPSELTSSHGESDATRLEQGRSPDNQTASVPTDEVSLPDQVASSEIAEGQAESVPSQQEVPVHQTDSHLTVSVPVDQDTPPRPSAESNKASHAQTGQAAQDAEDADNANASAFPELSWVGQLHGTYLIAQNEDGMYLIDQHAAHERIHYEYYAAKFGQPEQASQQLLVPMTLEYTSAEAQALTERMGWFEEAGVELEPFGPQTFLVRSHPAWLPKGEEQQIIEEMAEWILTEKKAVDIGKLREKSAILCSCKASIKANQRLSREEGEVLLQRLAACRQPYTCPHGRPILVHISVYQLEKMFKRVMS